MWFGHQHMYVMLYVLVYVFVCLYAHIDVCISESVFHAWMFDVCMCVYHDIYVFM
jgi:hypothetical protein